MNRKHKFLLPAMAFAVVVALQVSAISAFAQVQKPAQKVTTKPEQKVEKKAEQGFGQLSPSQGRGMLAAIPPAGDTSHNLNRYFIPNAKGLKAPDAKGFIQRWMVLEPVKKNLRGNSAITESYLRTEFASENFSQDYSAIPDNGQSVKIGTQDLKWYALDSKSFNFNLYHFSYATNNARAGVMFWLVTVINCPQEMKNVRLAAGVNSGGAFWLNGKEALIMPGDKDIIVDNAASQPLTLKKGRNVVRALVINGQGMCNFCVRFLDENGSPVKNYTISYQ